MKTGLLVVFLIFSLPVFSQQGADTLNQYNTKHKKHGFWKVYVDDQLMRVKDVSQAFYFGYDLYDNGELLINCSGASRVKKKAVRVEHNDRKPLKGNPEALDGNYKIYSEKGLELEEEYKSGIQYHAISYYTGENHGKLEDLDYRKTYQGQFGSCYHEMYYPDGTISLKEWLGKNEKGKWGFIKIK